MSKSTKTAKKATKPKAKTSTKAKAKKPPVAKKKTPAAKKKSASSKKKPTTKKATSKKKAPTKKKSPVKKTSKPKPKKTTAKQDDTMLKELEIEMGNEDEQVSLGAIGRLGFMTSSKATKVLIGGLKDPRHMVRIHVAAQRGERKDKKAVDALIESLQDESVFVRQTVAGALENISGAMS